MFRIFLKSEFCEENIEFWLACEDFRNITSHKELASKAAGMHEEFIKDEAPKEVTAAIEYKTQTSCWIALITFSKSEFITFKSPRLTMVVSLGHR